MGLVAQTNVASDDFFVEETCDMVTFFFSPLYVNLKTSLFYLRRSVL